MDESSDASRDPEASRTRRSYREVEAIHPHDGSRYTVLLSDEKLKAIAARSRGQILEARDLVPLALQYPTAIFEGLCFDSDEPLGRGVGWRCYCTVPTKAYARDGTETDPYPRELFLVFINSERVAYNWYWIECDSEQADLPINYKTRFKARLL